MPDGTTALPIPTNTGSIHVDRLFLDPKNPRLVVEEGASQALLAKTLYEDEGLDELVHSFLENGYFQEEPLVVVPIEGTDNYWVVEGNRRLATIKLLHSAELRRDISVDEWPVATAEQLARLEYIPCVIYARAEDVLPYLGFRHITGAKKWGPYQRARFVSQMLDAGYSLNQVEDLIGDTSRTVKKLYQDYLVFMQATNDLGVPEKTLRDRFSLLEVALGQAPIKAFLGVPGRLPDVRLDGLVPADKLPQLQEVVNWVFGSEDFVPVIRESRDISRILSPVVANAESLEHLRRTSDLEAAYDFSDGERIYLLRKMSAAEKALRDAAGYVAIYRTDAEVEEAIRRIFAIAMSLSSEAPAVDG